MASKYKGSIKLPAGLSKMGSSDYKLVDANDINICTENATSNVDKSLTEVIEDIYSTLHSRPVLSYVDEPGYGPGQIKYWNIGDEMKLKFTTFISSGTMILTILKDGILYLSQSIASVEGLEIPLGVATKEGTTRYTVSAVSTLGEAAEQVLEFTQVVGSLVLTSSFDSKTIRSSGSYNRITIPFRLSYAATVNTLTINALIYNEDGVQIYPTATKSIAGTSTFESAFDLPDVYLDSAGRYTIKLEGSAVLDNGETTQTELLLYFSAITEHTLAAILQSTNMSGQVNSDDTLSINYLIETNIESFKTFGVITATLYIYEEGYATPIRTIKNKNITSGYAYSTVVGRLPGGQSAGDIKRYSFKLEPTNDSVIDEYNKQSIEGGFSVKNTSDSTAPVSGDLFTFDAIEPDQQRQSLSAWYSTLYNPAAPGEVDYYKVKLQNTNGVTTGFIQDTRGVEWGNMLRLNGNALGEIWKYDSINHQELPFYPFSTIESDDGFTFEAVINTKNVGVTDAIALICGEVSNFSKLGFKIDYSKLTFTAASNCVATLANDYWVHVAFVLDKTIRNLDDKEIGLANVENLNPIMTLNVYVNGIRSAVQSLKAEDIVNDNEHSIYLNSSANYQNTGGECCIKMLRCYSKPLTAADVLQNYYNAISYNTNFVKAEKAKNSLATTPIPVLYMVRNTWLNSSNEHIWANPAKPSDFANPDYNSRYDKKAMVETDFATLNAIKDKPTSKESRVNCTVWYTYYNDEGKTVVNKWDDVDVFLQGTSSLEYPVKNYKFKIYKTQAAIGPTGDATLTRKYKVEEEKADKLKTLPFDKQVQKAGDFVGKDGWYVKDSTYTLKCDYMEQSHKNNTPTAMFYEKVLDTVASTEAADNTRYTIAKDSATYKDYSTEDPITHEQTRQYRDAIEGFPILLYFDENNDAGVDHNKTIYDEQADKFTAPESVQYVGSYMFNTDKGSNSLGFEIKPSKINSTTNRFKKDSQGSFIFDGLKKVEDKYYITNALDLDKDISERRVYTDINGDPLSIGCLPCTSMEGKSNTSGASAATFYTLYEANIDAYNTYLGRKYYTDITREMDAGVDTSQAYAVKENSYLALVWGIEDYFQAKYGSTNFSLFRADAEAGLLLEPEESGVCPVLSPDIFNQKATAGTLLQDDEVGPAIPAYIYELMTTEETGNTVVYTFINGWSTAEPTSYYFAKYTKTQEDVIPHDDYDYISRTFEVRWAYSEEVDLSGKIAEYDDDVRIKNQLDFDPILHTINWFKSIADEPTEKKRKERFVAEFKNHFSYSYAMTYYLQMMMFIQVDNAGKNAMFDQWGDGKWYVRPYDMDTQMGLDNSGLSTIGASAELNPELSPTTFNPPEHVTWSTQSSWSKSPRVLNRYNTPNSRLWIWFGKYFKDDIEKMYRKLRTENIYETEDIINFIEANTSDIIGQTFYNKDGAIKYLTQVTGGTISSENLQRLQGCRECSYRQILNDRLVFLDSYFDASSLGMSKTKFNVLSIRSDAGKVVVPIIISVYSPTYIKMILGSGSTGKVYAYVDPSDMFKDPMNPMAPLVPGVQFNLELDGNDKEIIIYGLESIVKIQNLEGLNLRKFDAAGGVVKMTEINLSNSSNLNGFVPGSSPFLRTLDLSNCGQLGTGDYAVTTVDASNCPNLEKFTVENSTYIQNINLPKNSLLSEINFSNTSVTTLNIEGLTFLESQNLHYEYCGNMSSFIINNCPRLTTLSLNGYPALKTVRILECPEITEIQATNSILSELTLTGCSGIKKIDLSNGSKWVANFKNNHYMLDLHDQVNLEELDLTNCGSPNVKLLLVLPQQLNHFRKFITNHNTKLNDYGREVYDYVYGVYIDTISAPRAEYDSVFGTLDFSAFTVPEIFLQLRNLYGAIHIKNLHYKGICSYLFYSSYSIGKSQIEDFENCTLEAMSEPNARGTAMVWSAAGIFGYAGRLKNLKGISFDATSFANISDGGSCFYACTTILPSEIIDGEECGVKKFLQAIPNVTSLASMWGVGNATPTANSMPEKHIPSDFFEYNHHIQNLSNAFTHHKIGSVGAGLFSPIHYTKNGAEVYPLTSINGMFCWQPTATFPDGLPYNFFMKDENDLSCKNVTNFSNMFYSTNFPGFKDANGNYTLNILYPANNALTNISKMFQGCGNLHGPGKITYADSDINHTNPIWTSAESDTDNIKVFLSKFPNLTDASLAFHLQYNVAGTTGTSGLYFITEIPELVFENNKALVRINGTFSNIHSLKKLPQHLFSTVPGTAGSQGTATHKSLVEAAGLFAGCSQLEGFNLDGETIGIVPKTLFYGAPNITTIGKYNYIHDSTSNYWKPGAFANTKIQGIELGCLDYLEALTDVSFLFWKGVYSSTGSTSSKPNLQTAITENSAVLKYIHYMDDTTPVFDSNGLIPVDIFKKNRALTDVSYAFAGNTELKGFGHKENNVYSRIVDSNDIQLFNNIPSGNNTLEYAAGLFLFDGLTCDLPNYLFTNCSKLKSIAACFAECKSLNGSLIYGSSKEETPPFIRGCSALETTKKVFYHCERLLGVNGASPEKEAIPKNLFEDCRNTITDVSGMFFGCSSLTGSFEKSIPEMIPAGTYSAIERVTKNTPAGLKEFKYELLITLGADASGSGTGIFKYRDITEDTSAAWEEENISYTIDTDHLVSKSMLAFNAIDLNPGDAPVQTTYTLSIPYIKDAYHLTKITRVLPEQEADTIGTVNKSSGELYSISRKGLLADCYKLLTAKDLFAGCSNLYGNIPEDLFFSSTGENYESLTDISGLFMFCKNLGYTKSTALTSLNTEHVYQFDIAQSVLSGYFFPVDWVSNCNTLNTIANIFRSAGCAAPENADASSKVGLNVAPTGYLRPSLTLSNADPFKSTTIEDVSYAFAGVRLLDNAELTYNFMGSPKTSITDASGMFRMSNIKNAGKNTSMALFGSNGKALRLTNADNMFETRYTTFSDDARFFDPDDYPSSLAHTSFIHRVEITGKIDTAYYDKLRNQGYVSNDESSVVVSTMLGSYANYITNVVYTDLAKYGNVGN